MTREEAVARIKDHKAIHKMDEPRAIYISEALDMAIKALENQKTGHWIRITNGALYEKYVCSECGRYIADDGIEGLLSIKYPYCHCGAKMKGEKE